MFITKKDKKLILLLFSTAIVSWLSFLSISHLVFKSTSNSSNIRTLAKPDTQWINTSQDITSKSLENRVILLNFWTDTCVSCIEMIPRIKALEEEFGDNLSVISVYSSKDKGSKDVENIKNAVLKHDITHLVINDVNFSIWDNFKISSWPTLVLLDPKGFIKKKYIGESSSDKIHHDIKNLIKKYKYQLTKRKLPIVLEKEKIVGRILQFPSKIEYIKGFSYQGHKKTNVLAISNTSKHNVLITSLDGKIILEIGSGTIGFEDGNISSSSFNFPRGTLYKNNILYVADTGNHALRKIDFKNNKVTTIAGSGSKGGVISSKINAKDADLASPWDLEFFPDSDNIVISNAGTNQLLKYNITKNTIIPFAGNGTKNIIDGKYPDNALAQSGGLNVYGNKLYFVDSKTSSLRQIDEMGTVQTLTGKSLSDHGHKNGTAKQALMLHPLGIVADDTGLYVADTNNHSIRKYDIESKKLSNYSGKKKGNGVGKKNNINYNKPEDLITILDKFYIADTNNHRIIILDRTNGKTKILDIIPDLKIPKEGLLEYLPNLETIPSKIVKNNSDITLSFNLKKGWKINELAPSFFNLVEVKNNKEALLIANYDWNQILSKKVILPKLSEQYQYYLQGTLYYCQDKENALCRIQSYEQKLIPKKSGDKKVAIDFIYQ